MKRRFLLITILIYIISFTACRKKENITPNDNSSVLTAFIGDTITLAGKNLGTDLLVKFGTVKGVVLSVSATGVKVVVPDDIEEAAVKIHLFSGTNEIIPATDFKLQAPVIQSLSADSGFAGQQIIITGKGFSSANKLSFGDKVINTIDQNHTTLTIKVPDSIPTGKYNISVTVAGLKTSAPKLFNIILPIKPTFTSFSPQTAFIGDTITLEGEHLGTNTSVSFGNVEGTVISASGTSVRVVVPDEIEEASAKIKLMVGFTELTSTADFQLKAPVIDSISVTSGFSGQYFYIHGKGFRKSYKTDQIVFGNTTVAANAGEPGHTELYTSVPRGLAAGTYAVKVTVAGMTATANELFEVIVPTITSFTPHSGSGFTQMIITGTNLKNINQGMAATVSFVDFETVAGLKSGLIISADENQIKLYIPDGLKVGNTYRIIVSVLSGTAKTTEAFTFTK